jgi:hypothetical protein
MPPQIPRCCASVEYSSGLAIWHDEPTKLVACLVTGAEQVLLIPQHRAGNFPVRRRAGEPDFGRPQAA